MDDLNDRLQRLSARGEPRGAGSVLGGARTAAARSVRPPYMAASAIVAAIAVILSGTALVTGDEKGRPAALRTPVASTTTTEVPPATAPPSPTTTTPPTPVRLPTRLIAASRLQPFANCTALLDFAKRKALEVVGPYGLPGAFGYGGDVINQTTAPGARREAAAPAFGGAAAETVPFSETNVQEKGIDEPDQVKTDGERIFAIAQGRLWAVRADGPRLLGSLAIEGAQEIFLTGNRVIVFGGAPGATPASAGSDRMMIAPYPQRTRITVVDVTNPGAMQVASELVIDGTYLSARLVGGIPRVVVRSAPRGIPFVAPRDDSPAANAEATERNRQAVRSSSVENWAPTYWAYDRGGRPRSAGPLGCATAYRPPAFSGFGTLTVLNFDSSRPERSPASTILADGEIVYASANRLFVATNQWGQIDAQTVKPSPRSLIHEFDITDPRGPQYLLSGEVKGTVLNQFSMSEQGPYLRVATTLADFTGPGKSESFVTVLGDGGGALVAVGQVGGLGKGERIFAVRFIGDAGYVVTFRQVDPLYVVDLADPKRPRVVGELKIPGYSAYLHPIGPGLLLGVGQDVTPDGRPTGSQVSVFDVSNPAAPRRLAQHALGTASNSPAEFDHHAFLYWEPTGLAVLPIQQYEPRFAGAVGMKVTRAAITEVGRVQHPADERYGGAPFITRSLVIGSRLFTLSDSGILASDLNTLASRAFVRFG